MNTLARFLSLGMQDADRRIAAALEPPPLDAADRYLMTSATVIATDVATRRLQTWCRASEAVRAMATATDHVAREPWQARYQSIALTVLTAVIVNVGMTMWQGSRLGWFWMVIPAMAATFATLTLAGSRR